MSLIRIDKASAFIKSNMPLSQGGSLSDQQAWDLSLYINSQARPQDPRFKSDLEQTTKAFHGKYSQYGLPSPVDGHLLGSKAYCTFRRDEGYVFHPPCQ